MIWVALRCAGCDNAESDLLKAFLQQRVLSLVHILHFNVLIAFKLNVEHGVGVITAGVLTPWTLV